MANSGSFFSSRLSKRRFSSNRISPGFSAAALALASSPTISVAKRTSRPSNSERRFGNRGQAQGTASTRPLGLPKWEHAITAAF